MCLIDRVEVGRRTIAHVSILHPLWQLGILHLIEIEGGRGRGLQEGHIRVDGGIKGSMVTVIRDGGYVVEPAGHTHLDPTLRPPI